MVKKVNERRIDVSFMHRHVNLQNIGQHDLDNSFIHADYMCWQFPAWQANHPGCTPVGICRESTNGRGLYFAMVFEDEKGNRYFTHVPASWEEEAKVIDKGWEACRDAMDKWWKEHKRKEL